jgi:hypothetical protein
MSIPNSHAAIFTRIPDGVSRTWSTSLRAMSTGEAVTNESSKHSVSLIRSIKLEVTFAPNLENARDEFSLDDETDDDLIKSWSYARQDWAAVIKSVQSAIDDITKRQLKLAKDNEMRTIETLNHVTMKVMNDEVSSRAANEHRPRHRTKNYDYGNKSEIGTQLTTRTRARTIHPDESASTMYGGDAMRSMLERVMSTSNSKSKVSFLPTNKQKFKGEYVRARRV